ncbi:hypothetical protein MMC18_005898 [Xylographa bjoerkii]|nr:hypothetical protein [Xylographa bjoerkii]
MWTHKTSLDVTLLFQPPTNKTCADGLVALEEQQQVFGKPRLSSPQRGNEVSRPPNSFLPVPDIGTPVCEQIEVPGAVSGPQRKRLKREGLSQLTGPPEASEDGATYYLDVVAIHGLNGHPHNTWTFQDAGGDVFWLQSSAKRTAGCEDLHIRLRLENIFSSSTGDTSAYAKGLLDDLNLERSSPAYSSRPIVFICHSMGGLVCKKALVIANNKRNRYQWVLDSTKAIFFFGTPHHDSDIADTVLSSSPILQLFDWGLVEFAAGRGKLVRIDLIKELSAKSKALDDLRNAFVERTEQVVTKRSATIGVTHEDVLSLPKNHFDICRIENENEPAYRRIVKDCRAIGKVVVEVPRSLSTEEQNCLESPVLSNIGDLFDTENLPARDTCEWVLSIQQFNEWRNGLPPLLWISGELGCGKTTLMSFLKYRMVQQGVSYDETGNRITRNSTVGSFFCEDRNKSLMNATAILRGLVWDIVSQRHDIITHVLKEFQFSRPWSYNQLWRSFQAILDDPMARGACILIDALDDCDKKDRGRLLEYFGTYLGKKSQDGNFPINIIVSSRPSIFVNLKELGAFYAYFKLDEDKVLREYVAADIRRFVHEELLNSGRFESRGQPNTGVRL